MTEPTLVLKSGKDRPVRFGHPWIFSGAIDRIDGEVAPGGVVRLCAADGSALGRAYFNPRCAIAARVLTRHDEPVDAAFIRERLAAALGLRRAILPESTNAFRLVNGEGDGLPGLIVDVYASTVVLQCLTAGADGLRPLLLAALQELLAPDCIYERSSGAVRREEGLESFDGVRHGSLPGMVEIVENGLRFAVDIEHGQKTGFFLDQRDNRQWARGLAGGRRVLNAFGYTGAFAVYAAAGGAAQVVSIDSSAPALVAAQRNVALNPSNVGSEWIEADVFHSLRQPQEPFDLLVLDPPALVKRRHDVDRGARAYKDLHLQAFRHAAPGAFLLTFSCSQHLSRELFAKIIHGAAADARRDVQIVRQLGAGGDHPVALAHPEGEYLKGLLLRVR